MATFAAKMLEKYQAVLLANPGVTTIVVDGVTVSYADLEAKVDRWQAKVDRQSGKRPFASSILTKGPNA